ncbi:transglycosylase domain-containing protein [Mangrovibacterium diazotrophicum]|uniref:Penicillin-binding protein 1A n=1 Tax=Mangrovibacterium diazotrophicum TaxID=1261403 RepID=A0A419W900_9BACT|nr:transglycosylase domain-containing protein [Mangrovibacterium diazotrophicum]RKD91957.1 penicillin-binding protein 1A [Mangrovibacterium diazotrophicum]
MKKDKTGFKKYLIGFWSLFAVGVIAVALFFYLIAEGKMGEMPSFEDLENPQSLLASEVLSRDNVSIGRYFRENRSFVTYEQLPENLVEALLATEDVRFYEHSGIDLRGLFRVLKGVLTGDSSSGGGSTLSQQLAKMLFPRIDMESKMDLVLRKFKEWVIAVKLEKSYTKEEIITMYLNKYDFLNLAVGIKSAARIYFNTVPDSLTIEQSAMLVGMAKNSALFNPVRRPELTKNRRNVVLAQMQRYGYISKAERDSLSALPMELEFTREDFKEGLAPYFREYLRITMGASKPDRSKYASWQTVKFKEDSVAWETNPLYGWCKKNFKPDGTNYDLYQDGLRIYTTIDSRMQQYAEEAVEDHLKLDLQPGFERHLKTLRNPPFSDDMSNDDVEHLLALSMRQSERYRVLRLQGLNAEQIKKNFNEKVEMTVFSWKGDRDTIMSPLDSIRYNLSYLRSSMMAMDLETGQVRAYVGGPNYRHFMYDMVLGGKRQVGSTVKPFLYTLAMQNGLTPCTKVPNVKQQFILGDGTVWEAKNSGESEYDGKMVTLKWGLANSVNQISAWVMKQFNPQSVADVMHKMGVYSYIDPVPSMFLGTSDITLYEMVGAYGTFGNKGVYTQPIFVTRIEDKYGNVIATFRPERHDAIDEKTAYLMISLLRGVIDNGTGTRLRWNKVYGEIQGPIAGKTGTTQNHSDGWFMGVTPQLVAGVWTGGDLRSIRFDNIRYGQGANMALPIWGRFMKKVYADKTLEYKPDHEFEKPMNFIMNLDCDDVNGSDEKPAEFEDFF